MTRIAPKHKIRSAVLGLCAAAVALTGLAGTASAAPPAPTKVLIQAESGGFFGSVKSPKLVCKADRLVVVFKQLGNRQRPGMDERVAMDLAQANRDGYEWNIGNPGLRSGRFYARAVATPECKAANSVTLRAQQ